MGTGDFTIELWAYLFSYAQCGIWESSPFGAAGSRIGGFIWYLEGTGIMQLFRSGAHIITTSSSIVPLNQWAHLALIRVSGQTTIYVNGVSVGTTATSFNDTAGGGIIGGFCDASALSPNGYLDEFRITKGFARYTANFTPPTEEFLDS